MAPGGFETDLEAATKQAHLEGDCEILGRRARLRAQRRGGPDLLPRRSR